MRASLCVLVAAMLGACSWSSDSPSQPAPGTTVVVPQAAPATPVTPVAPVVCSDGTPPPC
ncbi:MAG TPA: hypothetical protein VFA75_19170 [Nevskia sp.]|nr:hypothetical protein [Nevskia sp.]